MADRTWGIIAENLSRLGIYFPMARGVGHTRAIIDGLRNFDGSVIVLVSNNEVGRSIQRDTGKRIKFMPVRDFVRSQGTRSAIVFDHTAVQSILYDIGEMFTLLRAENSLLKDEIRSLKEERNKS